MRYDRVDFYGGEYFLLLMRAHVLLFIAEQRFAFSRLDHPLCPARKFACAMLL
ncbi:MAG: hypothetical protein V4623_07220 [Pseudomonadota bacterium]